MTRVICSAGVNKFDAIRSAHCIGAAAAVCSPATCKCVQLNEPIVGIATICAHACLARVETGCRMPNHATVFCWRVQHVCGLVCLRISESLSFRFFIDQNNKITHYIFNVNENIIEY